MANHASAEKRNRQRIKRTARNRAEKSALRTELKKVRTEGGDAKAVATASSALDRAASKGVIPVGRANRLKARVARAAAKKKAAAA